MQVNAADTSAVVTALKHAASATGSDFHYLLGTAMRESSLKANAQSSTSSATGLFQFIDQTWLGLVKTHGAKYGMAGMADSISVGSDGRYRAVNDTDRQSILALRKDPQIAALMAGEHSKESAAAMQSVLGRPVCGGELYAAHFLGPDAACKLIRMTETQPGASAAALFPRAASANRNVFFHADGAPKSVRDVYDWAMQQPGANAPVRSASAVAAPAPSEMLMKAAMAPAANIESLLASVMNWQPSGNFFSPAGAFGSDESKMFGGQSGLQPSRLKLTPGLLDIFSKGQTF